MPFQLHKSIVFGAETLLQCSIALAALPWILDPAQSCPWTDDLLALNLNH